MKKNFKILFISLLSIAILSLSLFFIGNFIFDPHRGVVTNFENSASLSQNLSKKDALKDFDYAFKKLKSRHPIWLEKTEEAKYFRNLLTSKYQENKEIILENNEINVAKLHQLISEVYAVLEDGHTRCTYISENLRTVDNLLPLMIYGNPLAINGIDVNELYEIFKTRYSFETDIGIKKDFFSEYIFREDILSLVEIDITKPITYTYKTEKGLENFTQNFVFQTKEVANENINNIKPFLENQGFSQEEIEKIFEPYVKTNDSNPNKNKFVYYKLDTEKSLGIFTLRQCIYNTEYQNALNSFFGLVKLSKIKNIAVDLRGNTGGNSWVANEFIKHLDVESYDSWDYAIRYGPILKSGTNITYDNQKYDTNFQGNLYILTDTKTYSAAMDFAMLIQDNNLGKIIGEPSSNKPESYGDILYFQLPNSKLRISISFKKWYRIDQTKKDLLIEPDIPCDSADAISVLYETIKK